MGLLKQTGTYIFKREAYRGYRHVAKNGLPTGAFGLFEIIGCIGFLVFLFAWIVNDGLPTIFIILSACFFFMTIRALINSTKRTRPIYKTVPIHKIDRRYKVGVRQVGSKQVKVGRLKLSESERITQKSFSLASAKKQAILFITCSLLFFLTGLIPANYIKNLVFKTNTVSKNH